MKRFRFSRYMISFVLGIAALLLLAGCDSAPAEAPDFTLPAANGGDVSLDDYKGEQPVLLYFHMAVG